MAVGTHTGTAHVTVAGASVQVACSQAEAQSKLDSHAIAPAAGGHQLVAFDLPNGSTIAVDISTITGVTA